MAENSVKKWYVVRAVSGQENKVKAYIETEIVRLGMEDYVSQVLVPTEKVVQIKDYGAFVEFLPGKDGLLHISEIDWKRLETVEEAGIKEGDEIDVKLLDIDPKTGKFKLSRKVLLPRPERQERPEKK